MNKFLSIYKLPLIISFVVFVAVIALAPIREPLEIIAVLLGSLVGTFVLDTEFLFYAYIFEPKKDYSQTLKSFINHKDLDNAVAYIHYNKEQFKDMSLNSGLFQIVLAFLCVFVASATESGFAKALVFSIMANSIYKLIESYYANKTDDWFWALKTKPSKQGVVLYIFGLLVVLSYCFSIL